ncbi:gamma-glutamylcyclotransferase family protein [Spirosoma oryzicola]|uniref:gamma-glutamylcyclotransferase family protein n=1 Tax=Spirosoma oryzicola TaxID=2898794 RepID=UPI001E391626|nr:gamma-glutamylcyclotransferase family protein [Spirosoma oryzicola]UHG91283.1 gamma-glutamylcyclotransferase [Spirosoma oryzicola]
MIDTCDFLFVYGTLRPNFDNAFAQYLRQRAQYVGEGSFPGRLFDLGSYPGAVLQHSDSTEVLGSVFDIQKNKETILTYLDYYEGVGPAFEPPTEYLRVIVPVLFNGKSIDCWAYLYNHAFDGKLLIESGDYCLYVDQAK